METTPFEWRRRRVLREQGLSLEEWEELMHQLPPIERAEAMRFLYAEEAHQKRIDDMLDLTKASNESHN